MWTIKGREGLNGTVKFFSPEMNAGTSSLRKVTKTGNIQPAPKKKPTLRAGRLFPPMDGSVHGLAHGVDVLNGGSGPPLGILPAFRMEGGSLLPHQRAHGGPRNAR